MLEIVLTPKLLGPPEIGGPSGLRLFSLLVNPRLHKRLHLPLAARLSHNRYLATLYSKLAYCYQCRGRWHYKGVPRSVYGWFIISCSDIKSAEWFNVCTFAVFPAVMQIFNRERSSSVESSNDIWHRAKLCQPAWQLPIYGEALADWKANFR